MKREVEREKNLPAFSIDVGELEILWHRMVALFENPETIHSHIHIKLLNETLKFNDIEDLKQHSNLKGNITKFSVLLFQNARQISIQSISFFEPQAVVRATAETEAWCAGAIETIYSFLRSHKVWYHWFVAAPIGWFLILLFNVPAVVMLVLPKESTVDKASVMAWLFAIIALTILFISRRKLFPPAIIRITEEESFIRRNSAELSLIIALLSAALTLVGWYLGK